MRFFLETLRFFLCFLVFLLAPVHAGAFTLRLELIPGIFHAGAFGFSGRAVTAGEDSGPGNIDQFVGIFLKGISNLYAYIRKCPPMLLVIISLREVAAVRVSLQRLQSCRLLEQRRWSSTARPSTHPVV